MREIITAKSVKSTSGAKQLLTRTSYAWLLSRMKHEQVKSTIKDKIALSVVEKDLQKPLIDNKSLEFNLAGEFDERTIKSIIAQIETRLVHQKSNGTGEVGRTDNQVEVRGDDSVITE